MHAAGPCSAMLDLAALETDDEWIVTHRYEGAASRIVNAIGFPTWRRCIALACRSQASDIDLIVYGATAVSTDGAEHRVGTAVQLGASNAASADVNIGVACHSCMAGPTANAMIRVQRGRRALVVGPS